MADKQQRPGLTQQKVNIGFVSGVDTKTDPKLAQGFLELENAYLENKTCKKSYGFESLVEEDYRSSDLYPKGIYSDNQKVTTVFGNQIYSLDSQSDGLISRGTFAFLARDRQTIFTCDETYGFKGQGYPSDAVVGAYPPYNLDSSYGDNAINIHQVLIIDTVTKLPVRIDYEVRVYNTLSNEIVRNFILETSSYTATVITRPLDVLGTVYGFFVYVGHGTVAGTMSVDEYYIPYEPAAEVILNGNIITDLVYADYTAGYVWHSVIRDLKAQSDGSYIYLGYRTGTQTACTPHVRVRNFNGTTVDNITGTTMGFSGTYSIRPTAATWISGDQTRLTLASFVYVPEDASEQIDINGQLYNGMVVFMFSNRFVIIDLSRQVILSAVHPVALGTFPLLKNSCYDICYVKSTGLLLFLYHSLNELYQNTDILVKYSPRVTETLPVVNSYLLSTATWVNSTTETTGTAYTTLNSSQYGSVFLASGFYHTDNNAYFSIAEMPYFTYNDVSIVRDIGSSNSSAINTVSTIAGGEFTPLNERKCNAYIVDISYNVVEETLLYVASIYNYKSVSLDGTLKTNDYSFYAMTHTRQNLVNKSMFICLTNENNSTLSSGEVVYGHTFTRYKVYEQPRENFKGIQYGSTSYIGINTLKLINQEQIEEVNWYNYPQIYLQPVGTQTEACSLVFAATFEYTLATGEVVRSAPSVFKRIAINNIIDISTTTVDIFVTAPPMLTKRRNFRVKIWRTINNGQDFYLYYTMFFFPNQSTSTYYGRVRMGSETIPLTGADPIQKQEFAYFNGGTLGDFPFETSENFTLHNNRVISITANNPYKLQYSNAYNIGSALSTSPANNIYIESKGGEPTAVASLDDFLIVFKQAYIFSVTGNGPNNNGINGSWSPPKEVNSPVGCINPASIIRIPDGIMFQSDKGIYLLDRSLVVEYIGDKVQRFNNIKISSSSLLPEENKVVFSTYDGITMVYDYYYKNWSWDSGIVAASSTIYKNSLCIIDDNNQLLRQNKAIYTRDGSFYSTKITTPWFYLSGIQGLQRVYSLLFLGKFIGVHKIRVSCAYDFVDTVQDYQYFEKNVSNTFGAGIWGKLVPTDPYGGTESSTYQFDFSIPQQRCSAIRFTFEDFFDNIPFETGGSFELTDLTLVYGIEALDPKLPTARR